MVEQLTTALASGDAEGACALISANGLEELEADTGGTCEEAFAAQAADLPDDAAANAVEASFEVLEESEDSATVELSRPGDDPETFELVLEDGDGRSTAELASRFSSKRIPRLWPSPL